MNDILFGTRSKVITKDLKRYFKKNKVRNLAAHVGNYPYCFPISSLPWRSIWRPPSSSLYK